MVRVILLGGGNLASHLAKAFSNSSEIELTQIFNRTLSHIIDNKDIAPVTDSLDELLEADICVICTSDAAIDCISQKLMHKNCLIVHTSGATSMDVLQNKRKGVFYPLQSFTKDAVIDFSKIPFCLETNNAEDYLLLEKMALAIATKVYTMSSVQRKKLHIAAVFVNNFVNYMYHIGEDICNKNGIPFEVLYPLIQETAEKIQYLSPKVAQTGPAVRKDKKTVALHESQLEANEKLIYTLLSEAISNNN